MNRPVPPGRIIERLPVFPLPHTVLYPNTLLPLHVFEPRYREMVRDCASGDRLLAVVQLAPGWEDLYHGCPPVHPVAGLGRIEKEIPLPDGRWNVLICGLARVRLDDEIPSDRSYRTFRATVLADTQPEAADAPLERDLAALRQLYLQAVARIPGLAVHAAPRAAVPGPPGEVCDRLAAALPLAASDKQRLMEALDGRERVRVLTEAISRLVEDEPPLAGDGDDLDGDDGEGGPAH